MAASVSNIFTGQVSPRDVSKYTLMRGVTDYSDLYQFNSFESGYSFLIVLEIPRFLELLASANEEYDKLIKSYRHILEYEFRGLSGFDDMSSDPSELTNGTSSINIITKVNYQSAGSFSMRFFERSGLIINKVHELFLRGIKDPQTKVKTYDGLLRPTTKGGTPVMSEAGYEYETFQFLYFVTDNTCLHIEKAYLIASAQPTNAPLGEVSNSEKGEIGFKELDVQFSGVPLTGPAITMASQKFLDWINENTVFEEMKYGYKAIRNIKKPDAYPTVASPKVEF